MEGDAIFSDYQVNDAGEKMLPIYCGYTVDIVERAFYRVGNDAFEYIPFTSGEGGILIRELLEKIPRNSRLYQKLSQLTLAEEYLRDAHRAIVQ